MAPVFWRRAVRSRRNISINALTYHRWANGPPTYRIRQHRSQDLFSPRKDFRKQNLRSLNPTGTAVCCPPSVGARERSPRLARLFSLETRLKSVVSAESFCLGLDCVLWFSAAVSPFYHLSFCLLVAVCYNTINLIISTLWFMELISYLQCLAYKNKISHSQFLRKEIRSK